MGVLAKEDLHKGQMLFQMGHSRELIDVSGKSEYKFDHVALVVDCDYIIDATPWRGVAVRKMVDFLKSGKTYVATVANKQLAEMAVEISKKFAGKKYNYTFEDKVEKGLYCSQLITESFRIANGGSPYFKEDKLNFKNEKGEISQYWITYYKKYGMDVPQGQKGSHPSRLFVDKKIVMREKLNNEIKIRNYMFNKRKKSSNLMEVSI